MKNIPFGMVTRAFNAQLYNNIWLERPGVCRANTWDGNHIARVRGIFLVIVRVYFMRDIVVAVF